MKQDDQELRLIGALDALEVDYELLPCDPEIADTNTYCKHTGCELADCANTIVVKSKTGEEKFAACVVLATTRLNVNNIVRKRLGARKASFAAAHETQRITGMTIGGVTPIGLPSSLPLWVDQAVMERDMIILGGSSRSLKLRLSPRVFLRTANTEVVEQLASPIIR